MEVLYLFRRKEPEEGTVEGLAAVPRGWVGHGVAFRGVLGAHHTERLSSWEPRLKAGLGGLVPFRGRPASPHGWPDAKSGNNERVVVPPTGRVGHSEHHPLGEIVNEEFKSSKGPPPASVGKKPGRTVTREANKKPNMQLSVLLTEI